MSNGGIIGPKNNTSVLYASGIWSLSERLYAVKRQSLSYTFTASASTTDNGPTFTFNSINIGGPGLIVVAFGSENAGITNSLTIDGVSATKASEAEISGETASIWYAKITNPSSSSVSIVANNSATGFRAAIGVYKITNYNSVDPYYTNSATGSGTAANIVTDTIYERTLCIGSHTEGTPTTISWSGLIEDYETTTSENNSTFSSASLLASSSAPISISGTPSNITTNSLAVAAWY